MEKFEVKLKKELQKEREISHESRLALNEAYGKINQMKRKHRKKRILPWLIIAAVISLVIAFTPISNAMSNFFRFGKFTSENLKEQGVIVEQNVESKNQELTVSLKEVYATKNELGIHVQIKLPKNSILQSKEERDYLMYFAIKNGDGTYLADFKTNLSENKEIAAFPHVIRPTSYFDKEANTIDLEYGLEYEGENLPILENAVIEITQIQSMNKIPIDPQATGEQVLDFDVQSVSGEWELPIETSDIKQFNEVSFLPTDDEWKGKVEGTELPTSFIVTFSEEEVPDMNHRIDENFISVTIDGREEQFVSKMFTDVTKDGKNYHQMTFDYNAYNITDKVTIHLGATEIVLEKN
ncbi:DUF4179 domain-containing protein [Enterococcus sp. LJL99]